MPDKNSDNYREFDFISEHDCFGWMFKFYSPGLVVYMSAKQLRNAADEIDRRNGVSAVNATQRPATCKQSLQVAWLPASTPPTGTGSYLCRIVVSEVPFWDRRFWNGHHWYVTEDDVIPGFEDDSNVTHWRDGPSVELPEMAETR